MPRASTELEADTEARSFEAFRSFAAVALCAALAFGGSFLIREFGTEPVTTTPDVSKASVRSLGNAPHPALPRWTLDHTRPCAGRPVPT